MSNLIYASSNGPPPALEEMRNAVRASDYPRAFAAAEVVLGLGVQDPLAFKLRGLSRDERGLHAEALAAFQQALSLDGDDAAAHNAAGVSLARLGRMEEAEQAFDRAAALQPHSAGFLYSRAWAYEQAGDFAKAREAYEAMLERVPGSVEASAGLAWIASLKGDWSEARLRAERALQTRPGLPKAAISLARAEAGDGALDKAENILRELQNGGGLDRSQNALVLTEIGDLQDARGQAAEAFAAYDQANGIYRELYGHAFGKDAMTGSRIAEGLLSSFKESEFKALGKVAGKVSSPVRQHVFLLGFARSGTTLTGQMLASNPAVQEIDEQDTLSAAFIAFGAPADRADAILEASEANVVAARAAYWNTINRVLPGAAGAVLIDKLAMNALRLPLIARLFPDAKILFMRRDPRDVVLSCFRRSFTIGPVNQEFLGLESTARLYASVMSLLERCRGVFGDRLREQSYEALIAEPEKEMRAICDFIGVEWDAAMLDPRQRVTTDKVATRSASQVARGVYGGGAGQWRAYAAQLEPVMPTLTPWVEKFGYPAE
ncbi:MAG: tetratricopeptide repeat-containing sulfotransferase family protein [Caulobacteraceae bacterium]